MCQLQVCLAQQASLSLMKDLFFLTGLSLQAMVCVSMAIDQLNLNTASSRQRHMATWFMILLVLVLSSYYAGPHLQPSVPRSIMSLLPHSWEWALSSSWQPLHPLLPLYQLLVSWFLVTLCVNQIMTIFFWLLCATKLMVVGILIHLGFQLLRPMVRLVLWQPWCHDGFHPSECSVFDAAYFLQPFCQRVALWISCGGMIDCLSVSCFSFPSLPLSDKWETHVIVHRTSDCHVTFVPSNNPCQFLWAAPMVTITVLAVF